MMSEKVNSLPQGFIHFRSFNYLSAMKKKSILKHKVLQHTLFWILYFIFNVLRWGLFFNDFQYSLESNLVEFSIHILIVYFNLLVLIPRWFPRKFTLYILSLLGATALVTLARILLTYQLVTTEVWKEANIPGLDLFDPNYFITAFVGELYVVGFTMAIKLGIDYISTLNKTRELENKKLEAELSFLRSQVQPHFFFNTLNNLYSLTLSKSDKAPDTILKLSELMSYVIYQGKQARVKLHNEIKHIQDYLDLEKLRYGTKLNVNFEIEGSIDAYYMPPLILIPFVENCFKHGDTAAASIPISIQISVLKNRLHYRVNNRVQANNYQPHDKRSGIGIKNAIRRLDLLFKNNYSLEINQANGSFTISLNMPLYDKMLDN